MGSCYLPIFRASLLLDGAGLASKCVLKSGLGKIYRQCVKSVYLLHTTSMACYIICIFMYVHLHARVCTLVRASTRQKLALGVFLQPIVFETECFTDPDVFQFSYSDWPVSPSIPTLPPQGLQVYTATPRFFFYIGSNICPCVYKKCFVE